MITLVVKPPRHKAVLSMVTIYQINKQSLTYI